MSAAARLATPAIPAEAATWLRAHFDWTFGAVWVASDRYGVPAATVVAWAERLRAGSARAGLGGKERVWILRQVNDPEQRPTALESAMARTRFRGLEATPPLTIANIGDAIALIEARLAEDTDDRTTRDARELRTLLLDDLRILRDGGTAGGQDTDWSGRGRDTTTSDTTSNTTSNMSERRPDEMALTDPVADAAVSTVDDQRAVAAGTSPTHDSKGYQIRYAMCSACGKTFTSRKYPTGWSSYCSPGCGAKGRYAHKASAAAVREALPVRTAERTPAPAPEPVVTQPAADMPAVAVEGAEAAPETPSEEVAPPEPAAPAAPTAPTAAANGLAGLFAKWLLSAPGAAPTPAFPPALQSSSLLAGGGLALPSHPTTQAAAQTASVTLNAAPTTALLTALVRRLPASGQWTTAQRVRWVRAFLAALDLEIETTDETTDSEVA